MRARALLIASMAVGLARPAAGQYVVAAQAGLISYTEGDVSAKGLLRNDEWLRSGAGRAEVLLNPCVVLHLDEHSSLRMISNSLTDTRVELAEGSAIVQADAAIKDTRVMLVVHAAEVPLAHLGLFRLDAAPPLLKVYYGKAETVGAGRTLALDGARQAGRFDPQAKDAFEIWSERRVRVLARASGLTEMRKRQQETLETAAHQASASSRGGTRRPAGAAQVTGSGSAIPTLPPATAGGAERAHICTASGK